MKDTCALVDSNMSEEDVPPIAALFVVIFDQKVGYVQYNKHAQNPFDEC